MGTGPLIFEPKTMPLGEKHVIEVHGIQAAAGVSHFQTFLSTYSFLVLATIFVAEES